MTLHKVTFEVEGDTSDDLLFSTLASNMDSLEDAVADAFGYSRFGPAFAIQDVTVEEVRDVTVEEVREGGAETAPPTAELRTDPIPEWEPGSAITMRWLEQGELMDFPCVWSPLDDAWLDRDGHYWPAGGEIRGKLVGWYYTPVGKASPSLLIS